MSNTNEYIPYQCIESVFLKNIDYPDYPFLTGTGFFVFFPPYDDVFFITARHCVFGNDNKSQGILLIRSDGVDGVGGEFKNIFSHYLETKYSENDEFFEDVLVYVVGDVTKKFRSSLMARSLKLYHQDDVDCVISYLKMKKGNIRTVGHPKKYKSINYDENLATFQPRGFFAKIGDKEPYKNCHNFTDKNWKEGELNGFSGSPVIELQQVDVNTVNVIPIGILLTESYFISINVATNLIASYIISKLNIDEKHL